MDLDQENNAKMDFSEDLVTVADSSGVASEAYRTLRTNLFYTQIDTPPKVIVVTSPGAQEGKSTTCANLGVVLAQAGKETLVLDCDLRKPTLHNIFGMRNLQGLVDLLAGWYRPQEIWGEPIPKLKLISAGPPPPNPSELLSSQRLVEFLNQARQEFDYVLIDTPPARMASDSTILAAQADGVLLTLDSKKTRKTALRQTVHRLERVGANVLGTVMIKADFSKGEYLYHGDTYTSK